jgi:solute carrier family 13 (sodium-dependent dicarboxylate transporter), member 2/3/5
VRVAGEETAPEGRYGLRSRIGLGLGPALLVLILLTSPPEGLSRQGWNVLGLALLMATWWITEALPIAATALVPLVLVPLLGLGGIDDAATPFADPVIFLLLGGMIIALAVERHGLHRRIALLILGAASASPAGIVGGVMVAAAFISMWVSNTSTVLLMFPIGLSIIQLVGKGRGEFGAALMLGIGYSTLIGGLGTLVGTVPNALTVAFLNDSFGDRPSFLEWMLVGVPLIVVLLPAAWFLLTRIAFRVPTGPLDGWKTTIRAEKDQLGPMSRAETSIAIVFLITATLWVTLPFLSDIPGFLLDETGIAMMGALATFLVPINLRRGEFLMDWTTALKVPWGLLLLFGGGLSLASAIQRSGLAAWGAQRLSGLGPLSLVLLMLILAVVAVFASEIMSNTATAATILPIAGALALALGRDVWYMAFPIAFGASCAFMMPVGTPSNAIVYGSGQFSLAKMARIGLLMNLVSIGAITVVVYVLVTLTR